MDFWENIFHFEDNQTKGEILYFKLFELFIVGFAIHYAWSWGFYIQQISEVVLPLGIAQYIDISFMFDNGFSLVNAFLLSLFLILGFFRVLPHYSYFIALLLFHLHYTARFSLGEISHGSNFIGISLLALALALYFFKDPSTYRKFTLGFLIFFIGLSYTLAGFSKLVGTGISWPSGEHLWLWIAERQTDIISSTGSFSFNFIQEVVLKYHFISTAVLAFGWITELLGFLFWFDKIRPFITTALIGMHIGVYLTMNILFDVYIYELLMIGYPWIRWLNRYINSEQYPWLNISYRWSVKHV